MSHKNCSGESREFCDALFAELQVRSPDVIRIETSNCGFATTQSNRFAYLYHKAKTSLATIYLRVKDPEAHSPLSNGSKLNLRGSLKGKWAEEFPRAIASNLALVLH